MEELLSVNDNVSDSAGPSAPKRRAFCWDLLSMTSVNLQYKVRPPMPVLRRKWTCTVDPQLCLSLRIPWTGGIAIRAHFLSSLGWQIDTCASQGQACQQRECSPLQEMLSLQKEALSNQTMSISLCSYTRTLKFPNAEQ